MHGQGNGGSVNFSEGVFPSKRTRSNRAITRRWYSGAGGVVLAMKTAGCDPGRLL